MRMRGEDGNRGSQSDPSNYRPISLLPAIGKVMDDTQSSRLLSFLTTNKLISPHQFGFVPRSSTVHQLVYIINKWTRTRDTALAACLSEAATRLGTWLAERDLCINVNKTKAMLLPPKHQQCPADILIRCCDATLSIVNEYKYLGVIIDSTLSWEAHVDSVVSKVVKKIGTQCRDISGHQ